MSKEECEQLLELLGQSTKGFSDGSQLVAFYLTQLPSDSVPTTHTEKVSSDSVRLNQFRNKIYDYSDYVKNSLMIFNNQSDALKYKRIYENLIDADRNHDDNKWNEYGEKLNDMISKAVWADKIHLYH